MLCDSDGLVLVVFSKHFGILESNEVEFLAIWEVLCFFVLHHDRGEWLGECNLLGLFSGGFSSM